VIRATIDSDYFTNWVGNIRIGKTGEAYLLNKEGQFQTEPRSGGKLMAEDPDASKYIMAHEGTRIFAGEDSTGEGYLYATVWLKEKDWLLVVRQAEADAFSALRTATYLAILVAILGGIACFPGLLRHRSIIGRMERMDAEKGQLSKQLIVAERLAELGEMSAGFAHEINNPLQIIRSEQTLTENDPRGDAGSRRRAGLGGPRPGLRFHPADPGPGRSLWPDHPRYSQFRPPRRTPPSDL